MAHWLKVQRKQSSFITQNILILGAGADDAAGAMFRDTHQNPLATVVDIRGWGTGCSILLQPHLSINAAKRK